MYAQKQGSLAAALVSFISETKDVHADSTNPFHKNKYASLGAHLAVIKPIAAKHGLAIMQIPCTEDNCLGIRTTIIHKEGGSISEFVGIPANTDTSGQDAGSIISYLRRYALASIAGIATEDDDAEADRSVRSNSVSKSNYVPNPSAATAQVSQSVGQADDPIIPFGKNKGQNLSSLGDSDLDYWANKWEPKPWEKTGKVGPKDLALKAAAVKAWNERNSGSSNSDDVPF
jgi:hypothetical protein